MHALLSGFEIAVVVPLFEGESRHPCRGHVDSQGAFKVKANKGVSLPRIPQAV